MSSITSNLEPGAKLLSETIIATKYARRVEDEMGNPTDVKESWAQIIDRVTAMHVFRFPKLKKEIEDTFKKCHAMEVLPSMRSLQFGGKKILTNNAAIYNCAYAPVDKVIRFKEFAFQLLSGVGAGYSVQKHHIDALPTIRNIAFDRLEKREKYLSDIYDVEGVKSLNANFVKYTVPDTIEGWAESFGVQMNAFFGISEDPELTYSKGTRRWVVFDYSKIRPKGSYLKTSGGIAPGPGPLRFAHEQVNKILVAAAKKAKERRDRYFRLTPLECHDIICHISDCVRSGGIRRSALLCLFSEGDEEMMTAKTGEWYITNPQRARANNSVALYRDVVTKEDFLRAWGACRSGWGEPGFYFTNSERMGVNPCNEAALDENFCNLVNVILSSMESQEHFEDCVRAAAIIGTLQASYTNFHFLSEQWRVNTEKEALLGISLSGLAATDLSKLNLQKGAELAVKVNEEWARKLGINPAARVTLVKPSGTDSLVCGGIPPGIHAPHAPYFIRTVRYSKSEPVYEHFMKGCPKLVEDDLMTATHFFVLPKKRSLLQRLVKVTGLGRRRPGLRSKDRPEEKCAFGCGVILILLFINYLFGLSFDVGGLLVMLFSLSIPIITSVAYVPTPSQERIEKGSARHDLLKNTQPHRLVADPTTYTGCVINFPIKSEAPFYRDEGAITMMNRIKKVYTEWILPGHRSGDNTHNISATITVSDEEASEFAEFAWTNREFYNGFAVFPPQGDYPQAPFQDITRERYEELTSYIADSEFSMDPGTDSNPGYREPLGFTPNPEEALACSGGVCPI
jgi:ribonucleoside-diphosphate reductase alpha chain